MPAELPSTPQSAPPNFYSQVGKMASGPGSSQQAAGAATATAAKPGPMDADHEFLETVTKLLTVLAKIGQMQPRGQDVSKYTQAAADAMKQCVSAVFGTDMGEAGAAQTPGSEGTAAASASGPGADVGTGAGGGTQGT